MNIHPVVPGHEIVGRVTKAGSQVTQFKVGDLAGTGCVVDSCGHCDSCEHDLEQYCLEGNTSTYNSPDKLLGGMTYGGYSERIVVDEHFTLKIPENLDPMLNTAPMIMGRRSVAGSAIGGIKETQEMLDFCREHNIVGDIEMIDMQDINGAYERMKKSDVKYRFVIDMASLKQ